MPIIKTTEGEFYLVDEGQVLDIEEVRSTLSEIKARESELEALLCEPAAVVATEPAVDEPTVPAEPEAPVVPSDNPPAQPEQPVDAVAPTATVNGQDVQLNPDGTAVIKTENTTVTVDTTPEEPAPQAAEPIVLG